MNKKEWNNLHIQNWTPYLEKTESGLSKFQELILAFLKQNIEDYTIVKTLISDSEMPDGKSEMLELKSAENFKCWIYGSMTDFQFGDQHKIFERWGYISPQELLSSFTKEFNQGVG